MIVFIWSDNSEKGVSKLKQCVKVEKVKGNRIISCDLYNYKFENGLIIRVISPKVNYAEQHCDVSIVDIDISYDIWKNIIRNTYKDDTLEVLF